MLGEIHFRKTKIQRIVKFTDTCYYPLIIDNDWNINRLFGLSYGLVKYNSVSIGWRPSESKLDKIDLFGIIYKNGLRDVHYFYSITTNQHFALKIKVHTENELVSFYVFNTETGDSMSNFMESYKIPLIPIGRILGQKMESIIHKDISAYLTKSNFQYGRN